MQLPYEQLLHHEALIMRYAVRFAKAFQTIPKNIYICNIFPTNQIQITF